MSSWDRNRIICILPPINRPSLGGDTQRSFLATTRGECNRLLLMYQFSSFLWIERADLLRLKIAGHSITRFRDQRRIEWRIYIAWKTLKGHRKRNATMENNVKVARWAGITWKGGAQTSGKKAKVVQSARIAQTLDLMSYYISSDLASILALIEGATV